MQTPWTKTTDPSALDEEIDRLHSLMAAEDKPETARYAAIVDQLSKLYKLKEEEKSSKKRLSPDTLAMVGGNLAGILLILNYEKAGIITSKALGFVMKSVR